MHEPDEESQRLRGHVKDKRVLKYLRDMIKVCRYNNRRWLRMEYERAWEFASQIIYGSLPQPEDFSTGHHPSTVATQLPEGFRPSGRMPLRKIVKKFTQRYNTWEIEYETLECAHILTVAPGYRITPKSRRCPHCAIAAIAKKKKPAGVNVARNKAVSA